MIGSLRRRADKENLQESLSPEKRKTLHDASLNTLIKLYEKCYEAKVPKGALIDAIEKEIYQKYLKAGNFKIDRVYKLEKFVPKKRSEIIKRQTSWII